MEWRWTRWWHLVQLIGLGLFRFGGVVPVHSTSLAIISKPAPNGSRIDAPDQPTLRLGVPLTLSRGLGYVSDLGREIRQGYDFFISWFNSQGGVKIKGVPHMVDLTLVDDEGDHNKAAAIAWDLIHRQNVKLLLGPAGDNLTAAVADVVNDTAAVLVAPWASEDYVFERRTAVSTSSGVFSTLRPPNSTFQSIIKVLESLQTNIKSVSYIVEDVPRQRLFCNSVPGLASQFGMELKNEAVVSPGADSLSIQNALSAGNNSNLGVLIGCVSQDLCVRLLEAVEAVKIEPAALMLLDCVTGLDPNKEIGKNAMYVFGVTDWAIRLPLADSNGTWTAKSVTHAYAQRYKRWPSLEMMSSFAAAEAMLKAIEIADSMMPLPVLAAVKALDYQSAFGRVTFDEKGRNIAGTYVLQTGPWNSTRIVLPEKDAEGGIIFPFPKWEEEPCLRTLAWSRSGYNAEGKCRECPVAAYSYIVNGTIPGANSMAAAKAEVTRLCEQCPPIHAAVKGDTCFLCPPGHLVDAAGTGCTACPAGRFRTPDMIDPDTNKPYLPGDACTPCPPGNYQDQEGKEFCLPCGLGTATEHFGSPECARCPPLARQKTVDPKIVAARNFAHFCRWSSRATRFTSACMVCEDGPEGPAEATMCCDMGVARLDAKLTDDFQFEVRVCVAGDPAQVPEEFCTHLPRPESCNAYTPPASADPELDVTYYADEIGQVECKQCPQGGNCISACPNDDGNCTAHDVVRTRYIAGNDHYLMRHPEAMVINPKHGIGPFECKTPGACLGANLCHENMEGLMCNVCKPGFTRRWPEETCWKCPNKIDSVNWTVLGCLAVVFHIVVLGGLASRASKRPRALQSCVFMIFSNHVQMSAIAYSFCRPGFTTGIGDYLDWWFRIADALSQDPARAVMLVDCVMHDSGYGSMFEYGEGFHGRYSLTFVALILLPVSVVIIVVLYTIGFLLPRFPIRDLLNGSIVWPHHRARLLTRRGYGPWVLVTLFVLHPIATKFLLQIFDCSSQNAGTANIYDESRFVPRMEIACGSPEHSSAQTLAIIGLIIFSFGLPLASYLLLRPIRKKRKLREAWCFETFGFLYNGFEPEYYYWNSINMFRKVCYCICAALPGYSDSGRATVMLFMAMTFFTVSNAFRPWDNRAYDILDDLERCSIRSMIYMLLARLTQVVTDGSYRFNDPSSREARDLILMLMVLLMQVHVIWLTFWGLFREWLKPTLEKMLLMEAPEKVTLSNTSEKPREPPTNKDEGKSFAGFLDEKPKGYWVPNGGGCVLNCQGQTAGGLMARLEAAAHKAKKLEEKAVHKAKMKMEHKLHHGESLESVASVEEEEEEKKEEHDGIGDKDQALVNQIYKEIFTLVLRKTHKVDFHDVRLVLRGAMSMAVANSGILGKKKDLIDEQGLPVKPLLGPVTAEQLHVGLTQLTLKLSGDDWELLQRFDLEAEEIVAEESSPDLSAAVPQKPGKCCGLCPGGPAEPQDAEGAEDDAAKLAVDHSGADAEALAAAEMEDKAPEVEMMPDSLGLQEPVSPPVGEAAPPPIYDLPDDPPLPPVIPEMSEEEQLAAALAASMAETGDLPGTVEEPLLEQPPLPGSVEEDLEEGSREVLPPVPPEPPEEGVDTHLPLLGEDPEHDLKDHTGEEHPKKAKKKRNFGAEGDVAFESNHPRTSSHE